MNPYYEHALLQDPLMFYGREKEIQELCELISNKQCVAVVGQRRIGKSSLLYHLCHEETHSRYLKNWERYIFVYMDSREISGTGSSGFFSMASEKILRELGTKLGQSKLAVQDSKGFSMLIDEILVAGFIVVLCIDEFEGLVESINDEYFFGFLRSLGNNHRLLMVTSSRETLSKIFQTGNADVLGSLFWNIFKTIYLGLISVTDARRLIVEPAERQGIKFSNSDMDFALENAGPYPFFLQRVCFQLFKQYETSSEVRILDYDAIRNTLYNEAFPYLEDIWRKLSQNEKKLLYGEGASIKEPLRKRDIDVLKNKGLLDERYQIFSIIFNDFVREKRFQQAEVEKSQQSNVPVVNNLIITPSKELTEQIFSLQLGIENILGLELRGVCDFHENIKMTIWEPREIEEFRNRSRDLPVTSNSNSWRTSVNAIGKDLFTKFEKNLKVISVFSYAFSDPHRNDTTRVIFRVPRELIVMPLEWIITNGIPTISDTMPLTVLCPTSKYVTGVIRKIPPLSPDFVGDPNIRMLFISSNVSGVVRTANGNLSLPNIDQVEDEISAIEKLFRQGQEEGLIKCKAKFIHTGELSAEEIVREMSSGYDWIHYAGHGWFNENAPDSNSMIFFYTNRREKDLITPINAGQVRQIAQTSRVKGVYLSSCTGASAASDIVLVNKDFLGIMDALVVANVPSIIGMRWPIPDKSALLMAKEFYQAIFKGIPIDYALFVAKRAVYTQAPSDPTWASPILVNQLH